MGARGGAKCESERELGFEAKEFMVELTRNAELTITYMGEPDRYDRRVMRLSSEGVDVADAAIRVGHLRPWPIGMDGL